MYKSRGLSLYNVIRKKKLLHAFLTVNLEIRFISAECTIGMVWGLTALKYYGSKALRHYGTSGVRYQTLVLTGDSSYVSARFKNLVYCFQTISCLLSFKEGNQWISSAACFFPPLWKTKRSSVRSSRQKFSFVSLWGDSFTDVGYNIGQVATLLGCINRYRVFWTGLLLTPTVAA